MSDTDSKQQQPAQPAAPPDPDDRFRFIGFDIFPKQAPKFWKSDAEAVEYSKRVKLQKQGLTFDRDFSLLQVIPVSQADKIVITVVSLLLVSVMAMPWVGFRTMDATHFTLSWAGALGVLMSGVGTAFAAGWAVGLSALLGLFLMIAGPIIGLWSLVAMWTKAPSEDAFFKRLSRPLGLGYWLLFSLVAAFLLSFVGGDIPGYASWGLIEPGESYGAMTFVSILSYGPYLTAALGLVAGVKSSDL